MDDVCIACSRCLVAFNRREGEFSTYKDAEILGIGVLEHNKIMNNCIGTGMLTKESQRERGIGRSIILHLKEIVYEMGMTPVPGCWYYNINSRKTLESAGYITKSKLLHIIF